MNNKKHMEDILYYFEKYHYENIILDDNEAKFINDYIINLQSKIDMAIEYIEHYLKYIDNLDNVLINSILLKELLDILKEKNNE